MTAQLLVREAKASDVPAIRLLILEFAEFEKLSDVCTIGETNLHEAIFGDNKFVQALVALDGNRYVGYALFFPVFKSFRGERSMFLEDLYVTPDARGKTLGFVMLCEVARLANAQNCVRLDWQTLKWNERAIKFYQNLGAEADDENLDFRLRGAAFEELSR